MKARKLLMIIMIFAAVFLFAGCDDDNDTTTDSQTDVDNTAVTGEEGGGGGGLGENENAVNENAGTETETGDTQAGSIDEWLQQINNGQLPMVSEGEGMDYGFGYFVYYTDVENAIDTLIYNALVVHDQMASGDAAEGSLTPQQQNLLDITGDLAYDPDLLAEDQVQQSDEVRQAILARVVEDQSGLSPQEALDSNEVIGFVAGHSQDDIGRKYLVYTQDSPDAEFQFLGVVLMVDADGQTIDSSETYNFQGWENLPLLGDASGPFWDDLPPGVSGDPANTDEGRPGVLLVSQSTYDEFE